MFQNDAQINWYPGLHYPTSITSLPCCSVSLIECGPVNTDFLMNLKRTEPSDEALEVDAHTRSLYDQYLKHCQSVFQNAAQDTEDIIQVQPPAASRQPLRERERENV